MEVVEQNGKWVWLIKPGVQRVYDSKEEAYAAAGIEMSAPPAPEVKEYQSLEEAVADQDKDELDRFEDDLIAEETNARSLW